MRNKTSFAFTLVELAIVLVVIGILIGIGAGLIGILTKRVKYSENKESVKRAVEALKGYAIRFGYLPNARLSQNYNPSQEDPAFNNVGVSGFDAHGKALLYIPAQELTNNSTDLCSLNGTSFSIVDKRNTKGNIAFLVVSGNLNFNIQTNTTIYSQGEKNIDDFSYDLLRPEEYDDIAEYVSLFELQNQRCSYSIQGNSSSSSSCSSLTVFLDNNVRSYSTPQEVCSFFGTPVLKPSDYLEVYIDYLCIISCGKFTFSELINYDSNKNCKIRIKRQGKNCVPVDN